MIACTLPTCSFLVAKKVGVGILTTEQQHLAFLSKSAGEDEEVKVGQCKTADLLQTLRSSSHLKAGSNHEFICDSTMSFVLRDFREETTSYYIMLAGKNALERRYCDAAEATLGCTWAQQTCIG